MNAQTTSLATIPTATVALVAVVALVVCLGCEQAKTEAPLSLTATSIAPKEPPSENELRGMVDEAIEFTRQRKLDLTTHAAWQIFHGVLAYGKNFVVNNNGQPVRALDYGLDGGAMVGWVMRPGDVGLRAIAEPGSKTGQGHEDQWVAIIAQCDVPLDRTIDVGGRKFTMADLIEQVKHDAVDGKEFSWTLIALSHYLPTDSTWTAADGTVWSMERIMAQEARQDLAESACGGTHRLIGMTMALERYRQEYPDKPLVGGWLAGQNKIDDALELAQQNQLKNGAFSVSFFARSSNSPDLAMHLWASGHTLEFLSLALDDAEIREPWVARAVVSLCELLKATRGVDLECGALYHAIHGLVLYRAKRFGASG